MRVRMGWYDKLRARWGGVIEAYGSVAIRTYIGLCVVWFLSVLLLMEFGVDVRAWASSLGLDPGGAAAGVGSFGAAFAVYKVFMPVRLAVAVVLVPVVARMVGVRAPAPVDPTP
jgi:hypothetical protein